MPLCRYFFFFAVIFQSIVTVSADGFIEIDSIESLQQFASQDNVKVRMKPGIYRLEEAIDHHFIRFTGNDAHFDLSDVVLEIDNTLFSAFGVVPGKNGFYCVIDLIGNGIVFEGLTTRNVGDQPGIQSRNKIFNVVGADIVLRDVDITTSGSTPWGYGSLYGIFGKAVRKMNGIRVGWPAKNVQLIGCKVHMRAMGHAIFVQGAEGTLIENCHVDGLLRTTNEILAEDTGMAFDNAFMTMGANYVEGVTTGPNREILPDEMIALSEDGIRLYGQGGEGRVPTGSTTIRNCTVRQMRRGICTGLGPGADLVVDCEVTDCVAAGFNIGGGDSLEDCRANARYSEALSCPYYGSKKAFVDLQILESRDGLANTVLATLNGENHEVHLHSFESYFVPENFTIELGTNSGYAFYQKKKGNPVSENISLVNETVAKVVYP